MRDLNQDLANLVDVLEQNGFSIEHNSLTLELVSEPRDYQLPTHDEDC